MLCQILSLQKSTLGENLKGHLGDLDIDGWIILEQTLEKQGGKVLIGFIWLRTGTSGGLL
jgi:hypothetical protein